MLTVVTGPPCAGKTTHVRQHAKPGDIVIDYDHIAQAIGSPDTHDHPAPIAYVARAMRTTAIRAALGCARRGARVWIIDTTPTPHRQHQYAKAGAEVVTLTASRADLHRRADEGRPKAWHAMIDTWLDGHGEPPDPRGLRAW